MRRSAIPPILVGIALVAAADASHAQSRTIREAAPQPPPTTLEGQVLAPEGWPAMDALVSGAGQHTRTGADGSFRLELELPFGASGVDLTLRTEDGAALEEHVTIAHAGGLNPLGVLQLGQEGRCSPAWVPTFGGFLGTDTPIHDLAVFDEGTGDGPALFACGGFLVAGDVATYRVARWNGERWAPVGRGIGTVQVSPSANALAVFDDGSGPALYAGGGFTAAGGVAASSIARWNGRDWTPVGGGLSGTVEVLAVSDADGGQALYAGGALTAAGGVPTAGIARWDGADWSALGSGITGQVLALATFDDGGGRALFAGGFFLTAGGVTMNHVGKWDGIGWSALGSGVSNGSLLAVVNDLAVFDDGSGPALYAAGSFSSAGGVSARGIARWDGTSWSAVGSGASGAVHSLAVFDDGGGAALFAGGSFGGFGAIARWNGASWTTVASGINTVNALEPFDDGRGDGPALHAGGIFTSVGQVRVRYVARWDGASWSALGNSVDGEVRALATFDDGRGGGPALHAGGTFLRAGGAPANRVAKWDGASWSALGSGMDAPVHALLSLELQSRGGRGLYAGGSFTLAGGVAANRIARWNGSAWSALGSGMNGAVDALIAFDDGRGGGPVLVAGGSFTSAGGVAASHIARWNGAAWAPLGTGLGPVSAFVLFDDGRGSGPALHAGGTSFVARWNGTSWVMLGSGMDGPVYALASFDDGTGPELHAGGAFTVAGGVIVDSIARWNGFGWRDLADGTNGTVRSLAVFQERPGDAATLFVGGHFAIAGNTSVGHLARWNGQRWSGVDGGVNGELSRSILALQVLATERGGSSLFLGGNFPGVTRSGDGFLGRWGACPDVSAPILYCPTSLVVLDTGPPGEVVSFWIHARDDHAVTPRVVCVPPSGSLFPRGTTFVTCKATDNVGNQSVCEFPIKVR